MLGETLYTLRRKQGLSQEQLAERIGVSRQTISKWEGDLSTPDLEKLIALADCFGVSMDELTGYNSKQEKPDATIPPDPPAADESQRLRRIAGLVLCVLGIVSLLLSVILLILHPQTMQSIGGSFTVIIDGTGAVYGLCIFAVVIGLYLILSKP